jgi:hypothetical protein
MEPNDIARALKRLFAELADGAPEGGGAYILNSGDAGLLRSLDGVSADEASQAVAGGATAAAHAQHLRYALSLMNRWVSEGGNPFANAQWDQAWKVSRVEAAAWNEIRGGLKAEAERWQGTLGVPRELNQVELRGFISSVAHVAYHLGAIRQIAASARGPKAGTFV